MREEEEAAAAAYGAGAGAGAAAIAALEKEAAFDAANADDAAANDAEEASKDDVYCAWILSRSLLCSSFVLLFVRWGAIFELLLSNHSSHDVPHSG